MVIYFAIYTFLGYVMESCYVSILQRKWISSGLLKGPFIPLYGIGGVSLILIAPYLQTPLALFLGGGMIMTLIELLASQYIERVFHTKCWDYSKHHFNFHGRICLFYFIVWCMLSSIVIYFIHPFIISMIPSQDISLLLSLIYISFILKSFIDLLNKSSQKSLIKKRSIL